MLFSVKGQTMDQNTDRTIEELLDEAEARSECLSCPPEQNVQRALRRRIPSQIVSPARGLFARASYWDSLDRTKQALHIARAYSRKHPAWVFCGPTAAAAHGLEVPRTLVKRTYIASRTRSVHGRLVRVDVDVSDACVASGLPVTSALASAIDSLRFGTFPEALAVADSALRVLRLSRQAFQDEVRERLWRKHGAANARRAAFYASALSENGGESYARGVMIEEGFQVPRLQVEIPDPLEGGNLYRVDYLWGDAANPLVIGELDGRDKLANPRMRHGLSMEAVLRNERTRESRLSLTGARIMRFTFADVLNRPRFVRMLEAFGIPRV